MIKQMTYEMPADQWIGYNEYEDAGFAEIKEIIMYKHAHGKEHPDGFRKDGKNALVNKSYFERLKAQKQRIINEVQDLYYYYTDVLKFSDKEIVEMVHDVYGEITKAGIKNALLLRIFVYAGIDKLHEYKLSRSVLMIHDVLKENQRDYLTYEHIKIIEEW